MPEDSALAIPLLAATARLGSILAAAGCGKTEQIARATNAANGRRLLLTHTHAGVGALRSRLDALKVPPSKYRLETIAGWCLLYAASFPSTSSLPSAGPSSESDWNEVYRAAARLIQSGTVANVLQASYSGVFVDEYQDCTIFQHDVIRALAAHLPTCVFGDPLQAIFDFKGQRPVRWAHDVLPIFTQIAELTTPWRWKQVGNNALASWLLDLRHVLENHGLVDLTRRPESVQWEQLPTDPSKRQVTILGVCKRVIGRVGTERVVLIGDAANLNSRAALAQKLSKVGFSNIEPISCKPLYSTASKLDAAKGFQRLKVVVEFISSCVAGSEQTTFLKAVQASQAGRRLGRAKFGDLIDIGVAVAEGSSDEAVLELLQGFQRLAGTRVFRKEMFFAMRSALRIKVVGGNKALAEAIWEVQNRIRHAGRWIGGRSVGSTLLVKGLEFDHAVVLYSEHMTARDWYVALTRAARSVVILSPLESFKAAQ